MSRRPKDRHKNLAAEDRALWESVIKDVRPLGSRPERSPVHASLEKPRIRRSTRAQIMGTTSQTQAVTGKQTVTNPEPIPTIDRKHLRQLARGRQDINSRLDLHGMTQDQAYRRLSKHLRQSAARGEKCVLVITGKGGSRTPQLGAEPVEFRRRSSFTMGTGVLRRMVPLWLETAELAPLVHAYHPAHISHGGDGALYVMLRRRRQAKR